MKKFLLTLPVVALATFLVATAPSTTVSFASSSWDTAKTKAVANKKLFFVDFDASYCATCRNMDESTYMDATLAKYIENNVVALRVDVQDFDGVMWSQQYEVEALPTMLVFDANGKLVKRLVGYQSAANLLKLFQGIAATTSTTTTVENTPLSQDKPILKPVTTTTATTTTTTTGGNKLTPALTTTRPTVAPPPTPTSILNLYEIIVRRQEIKGFSLQVGVFSSYDALMEQAQVLHELFDQKTIVYTSKVNDQIIYKLMLGTFATRPDAQKFRETLQKNKLDGLIRDLKTMN